MFEVFQLKSALEVLQEDKTVADILRTNAAFTLALAKKSLSPSEFRALKMFNAEAVKKIEEITHTA